MGSFLGKAAIDAAERHREDEADQNGDRVQTAPVVGGSQYQIGEPGSHDHFVVQRRVAKRFFVDEAALLDHLVGITQMPPQTRVVHHPHRCTLHNRAGEEYEKKISYADSPAI